VLSPSLSAATSATIGPFHRPWRMGPSSITSTPSTCTATSKPIDKLVTARSPTSTPGLEQSAASGTTSLPTCSMPSPRLSPPQHADELLYDPDRCSCGLEWRCIPHDACFIHDSCLCEGSGSFPPVKPQRPSWAQYLYDWYCELAASLSLHPHSPLPCFGSEVEPDVMFFRLSDPPS